jgi:methyl-accepting chemotaxis protein
LEPPTQTSSQELHGFGAAEPEALNGAVERLAALDFVSTNVMIADTDYKITYMNEGVRKLLAEAESEIRKDLPNFNASQLIGGSLDLFHKNPAHQRRVLDTLREPYKACIQVGGCTFDLMATPVFDPESRARLGTMVEWSDAAQRLLNLDYGSQVAAIRKSQAVIEFGMDGTILDANDNFLNALGYTLDEIRGCHHSMFVD